MVRGKGKIASVCFILVTVSASILDYANICTVTTCAKKHSRFSPFQASVFADNLVEAIIRFCTVFYTQLMKYWQNTTTLRMLN